MEINQLLTTKFICKYALVVNFDTKINYKNLHFFLVFEFIEISILSFGLGYLDHQISWIRSLEIIKLTFCLPIHPNLISNSLQSITLTMVYFDNYYWHTLLMKSGDCFRMAKALATTLIDNSDDYLTPPTRTPATTSM